MIHFQPFVLLSLSVYCKFGFVEVSPGCELEVNFSIDNDGFVYKPPSGFSGIIPSRSLV